MTIVLDRVPCRLKCACTVCQVMERGYNKVMVLEDDIRFEPFFRQKVSHIMAETLQLELDWDLV